MLKPKKSLRDIKPYQAERFEKQWWLKIDSNENIFGASPKVIETLNNLNAKDIQFYPAYGEIIQKIADFNKISFENVIITNGADEAICAIFQTYLEQTDGILTVTPTFAMPKIYSNLVGANYIEIPYSEKWVFPINEFISKINDDIKLIHLTTPNNPTGETISKENILKILEKARDKVVIIDETYFGYCNETSIDLIDKYDNVFLTRSLSKDFALAGLRLGYIISQPQNIQNIQKVLSPYNVNNIAIKAGICALDDIEHFNDVKEQIINGRKILADFFDSIGAKVYPSKANFLCVEFGDKTEFVYQKLLQNNIIVKIFNDKVLQNTLRITIPTPQGIEKIIKILTPKPVIIFDMDGVLIDTSNSYRIAIAKTFEYFAQKKISNEKIQETKNLGGLNNDWDLTEFLLNEVNIKIDKQKIIEKFQEFYWDGTNGLIHNEMLIIDEKILEELSEDHNLSVFTGRPRSEAQFAIKKHGFERFFYPVITMDDLPDDRQKPDIMGVELIKKLVIADKFYYLGDTTDDMICAKNADIIGIGVLPPQDKSCNLAQGLENNGASIVLNNTNEIYKFLKGIK